MFNFSAVAFSLNALIPCLDIEPETDLYSLSIKIIGYDLLLCISIFAE